MPMSKHIRTKLASQRPMPEEQALQANKEHTREQQQENQTLSELDTEIECPRCNEIMELHSKFDELVYFCDNCSFLLKCV
jgi:transcription elongation factor Elf1